MKKLHKPIVAFCLAIALALAALPGVAQDFSVEDLQSLALQASKVTYYNLTGEVGKKKIADMPYSSKQKLSKLDILLLQEYLFADGSVIKSDIRAAGPKIPALALSFKVKGKPYVATFSYSNSEISISRNGEEMGTLLFRPNDDFLLLLKRLEYKQ
ncbi:MAG: hypothetical protein LUD17_13230 [Bacteroidales bacterium]|nr:hypothetical protein [Bacteroidales bacterium]